MAHGFWEESGPGRGGESAFARPRRARAGLRSALIAFAVATLAGAALAPAAAWAQAQPVVMAPVLLDGPSAPGAGPTELTSSIARDGTGAMVYLKAVGGTQHVFASTLLGGTFQPPVQVDGGLPGASSEPVVAAGPGGALVVAFLNGSTLYVAQRRSSATGLGAPRLLAVGAGSPALAMSPYGKTYLAFLVGDGAGFDVRVAFQAAGGWSIESTPLNVDHDGAGSPAVTAAGDGVAIVAWAEGGHVFSRRVWGTAPSAVIEQADAPLPGCGETSAGEPRLGTGGDSSYASVAFHETLVCAGVSQSRVLVNRLHGSRYDGVRAADGPIGTTAAGADHPGVAVGEYGMGWVTAEGGSGDVSATVLYSNEVPGSGAQVNALPDATRPYAVPSMAGLFSSIVAWQHDPGTGAPEIRARYADSDQVLGPELVLSSPSSGPTNAAAGLTSAGDINGDAAVAWVQSSAAGDELIADELFRAPAAPTPVPQPGYLRTTRPTLAWAAASEPWGSVRYTVTLDGQPLGQTGGLAFGVGTPLSQGRHFWQVIATNQAAISTGPQTGTFFIDSAPPVVSVLLGANRIVGRPLRLRVIATDHPAPLPAAAASGIKTITVRWGDGTVEVIGHRRTHVYRRPGRYRLRVTVLDRAGNATTQTVVIRIVKPSKPKPKPKRHKHA